MHATIRSLVSALARSPLFWVLAILLPFALGSPAFRSLVVFVAYAVIFVSGSVCLSCIALAGLYWIGADVLRGYRGPSLWSMLVTIGEWEGRCAARAVDAGCWILDRLVPAGPTGPLGIPACPTCPFGECCDVVDAPPVLTPALAADIDRVYGILSGRSAGIPTAAVFSPAPSFVALRAPLARLLPSWEEREASVPFGWASTDVDVPASTDGIDFGFLDTMFPGMPASTLRPDTSSEQGPAFDAWRHANRGDRFPLFLAPSTPLLTYRPLTIAPLPRCLPDVVADPCDPSDCPLCPVTLASGRHEVEPGTWTAEQVTVAACGPVESHPALGTMALGTVDSLPSDAGLDALALSDWPGSETEEAVDEKAELLQRENDSRPEAPSVAQDASGTPEPTPKPSSPVDASEEDTMPTDLLVGRDRLRKIAKSEGCSYSGKDGADALRAKIRAHRAYR